MTRGEPREITCAGWRNTKPRLTHPTLAAFDPRLADIAVWILPEITFLAANMSHSGPQDECPPKLDARRMPDGSETREIRNRAAVERASRMGIQRQRNQQALSLQGIHAWNPVPQPGGRDGRGGRPSSRREDRL